MSIQVNATPDGGISIQQFASEPTIYLDNWAFNKFSIDWILKQRLIATLNDKKGTLAFSIMNLVEVINKGDLEQIEKIKEFLDAVDVVLIDINPHKVIMREKMHVNGITELSPSADIEFLSNYALCVGSNLESFTASDIAAKALDEIDCFKYSFDHYFDKVL